MVGDVKQSIYKFRQAMPELFLSKYKKYSGGQTEPVPMDPGDKKNRYQWTPEEKFSFIRTLEADNRF